MLTDYNDLSCFPMPIYIIQSYTRLNYSEFLFAFIEDEQVIYREIAYPKSEHSDCYILSYSSLIVLYKIGIDVNMLIDNNVYIAHSAFETVIKDTDEIIKTNQKEHTTTIKVVDNELVVQETGPNEKQCRMKEAVNFKEYTERIPALDNATDLNIKLNNDVNIKEILGLCDYDAISIASLKNYTLVTAEPVLTVIAQNEECIINTIGIIDFLCEINISTLELLKIMKRMVEYRFVITLTENSFLQLLTQYSNSEQDIKDEIIRLWKLYLSTAESYDSHYREVFKQCISTVYAQIYNKSVDTKSMFFQEFAVSCMKYNNLRMKIDFNEEGELMLTTYRSVT